jgi:hypothetical protein
MLGSLIKSLTRIAVMITMAKKHLGPRNTDTMEKSPGMATIEELDNGKPNLLEVIDALTDGQKRDRRVVFAVLAIWFMVCMTGNGLIVEGGARFMRHL